MDILTNPTMSWLPPVVLATIVLIAALIGFWNGWKTALYFMVWNVIGLAAVLITMAVAFDSITGFIPEKVGDATNGMKARQLVIDNEETIKPIITIVVIIAALLVFNFIGFLIYWFFRKKLKRSIKTAKEEGRSTFTSRFIGASVGVITSLPIALSATMLSTAVSPETDFNKFAGKLTTGITFGQAKNADGEIKEVVTLVDIEKNMDDQKFRDALNAAFGGASTIASLTPETLKTLKSTLNSKVVAKSLKTLSDTLNVPKNIDFSTPPTNGLFTTPLVTDKDQQNRLIDAVKATVADTVSTKAQIKAFLLALGVFS